MCVISLWRVWKAAFLGEEAKTLKCMGYKTQEQKQAVQKAWGGVQVRHPGLPARSWC